MDGVIELLIIMLIALPFIVVRQYLVWHFRPRRTVYSLQEIAEQVRKQFYS